MSNLSKSCRTSNRTDIALKAIIVVFIIWLLALLVQEFTGTSLTNSITVLQWVLIISAIVGVTTLVVMRMNRSS
jgi:hypothetical protein